MQKWEYLELRTRSSEWEINGKPIPEARTKDFSLTALWNKLGDEGWEMYAAVKESGELWPWYLFKRAKS